MITVPGQPINCHRRSASTLLRDSQSYRTEDYLDGPIDAHVRIDHQAIKVPVGPIASVVSTNVGRADAIEFVEGRFARSVRCMAILDPLEFLLSCAIHKDMEGVLTFPQDALCSATHNHTLPQFGSLTNYDCAEFRQVVRIDNIRELDRNRYKRCQSRMP